METSALKKFAQAARQELLEQVGSKLAFVLKPESPARRESPTVVNELEKALSTHGKAALIDQVAYTWFNRFCALRFMDVNGYNRVGVVSPAEGQVQPEILAEAKSGVIDEDQINATTVEKIRGLLNGSIPSPDAQSEAYRLLIVGSCNALYDRMPYLFERIADFTELLMPDDLLSDNSILTKMRKVMTPESCTDVEIIGWLYQFYISEKKDEVFAALKKNQKITAENIPAATQLFTPHWIVRYLVENSLGRLWMLNRPNSRLTEQMEYYIEPEEPETDFIKVSSPEELRIADPAVGSGHMLTYAFDLLYAIYEEEGYDPNDIPGLILSNNLYGIEIDERAGALASFALEMKAAAKLGRRRFLRMDAKPNVCVLEDVTFTDSEMDDVMSIVGKDLYSADLRETLTQFEQAKNFGSLIVPKLKDPAETLRLIETKDLASDMWLAEVHKRLVKVLRMAEYLSPKYHVVVANPPYASASGLNDVLRAYSEISYPKSKNDLYSMFIERNRTLAKASAYVGMIAMQSWMYLKTFMEVRDLVLRKTSIVSLLHLGPRAFPEIQGERVQAASFVLKNVAPTSDHSPVFFRLISGKGAEKETAFLRLDGKFCGIRQIDFLKLTDSSVAYKMLSNPLLKEKLLTGDTIDLEAKIGAQPGSELIIYWWEVQYSKIGARWRKYNKGGTFRRWYGNAIWILDYGNKGENVLSAGGQLSNQNFYGQRHISWTRVSDNMNLRFYSEGTLFDNTSPAIFSDLGFAHGYLNSKVGEFNRTGKFSGTKIEAGHVQSIAPVSPTAEQRSTVESLVDELIHFSCFDWDGYETSWDFNMLPLLSPDHRREILETSYSTLRTHWQGMTAEMQRLEEENNRIFIEAYGLQDELTPEVPIEKITLTCNPAYRYGIKGTEEEREARLKADTMAEFLSYAVGCMFGRYSLDEPGLILANQGETLADYLARIPEPTFMPDDDNVIPMIDFEGDWFEDDITERFKQFLRVTFGDKHYAENLTFIEDALGKSIQKYFVKDFYNDHVQRYKKRPIYWLFSSPKGTFNALIYMHRYTPSTVSVVLNEYLREFRTKLEARRDSNEQISISASSSQKEKTAALKMIQKLDKAIDEVNDYERDVLYPLAGQNIPIDLDDGVKHNYPLFGKALKKITGLS
ncbi:MAG: SAM-dependent methyltransferase [Oceanospirillaceae bacterium]|nr:SAM-dependent methyltransferase [Oceanospirillaceae bacterium]